MVINDRQFPVIIMQLFLLRISFSLIQLSGKFLIFLKFRTDKYTIIYLDITFSQSANLSQNLMIFMKFLFKFYEQSVCYEHYVIVIFQVFYATNYITDRELNHYRFNK